MLITYYPACYSSYQYFQKTDRLRIYTLDIYYSSFFPTIMKNSRNKNLLTLNSLELQLICYIFTNCTDMIFQISCLEYDQQISIKFKNGGLSFSLFSFSFLFSVLIYFPIFYFQNLELGLKSQLVILSYISPIT